MIDFTSITLGSLLSHANETIRRNAMSILKQLQRDAVDSQECAVCHRILPHGEDEACEMNIENQG